MTTEGKPVTPDMKSKSQDELIKRQYMHTPCKNIKNLLTCLMHSWENSYKLLTQALQIIQL